MKIWDIIFKVIILMMGAALIAFNVLFYNFCERQKAELTSVKDKQDVESEFNSNKFKYQADQIERFNKGLEDLGQQVKTQNAALDEEKATLSAQKDALLQEVEKRQQIENTGKYVQKSLIDTKAEADAIKQDMKGWQKDYVSVLAELDKKMDSTQAEMKSLENGLTVLNIPELKGDISTLKDEVEKLNRPSDTSVPTIIPITGVTTVHTQSQS